MGTFTKRLTNYANPTSLGSRLRKRRSALLLTLLEECAKDHKELRVLDIGGTVHYWNLLPEHILRDLKVRVTILNLPGTEIGATQNPMFDYAVGDGCDLGQFGDDEFHIAHSNSVLEHVGDWTKMSAFANETKRVAKRYFVQTPNYWFPVEPHCMTPFFHWLPKPTRVYLVHNFALGNWPRRSDVGSAVEAVESARLLNRKMFAALFDSANVHIERLALLPKSLIAIG